MNLEKLVNGLKILTGRKLSEKTLARARGEEKISVSDFSTTDSLKDIDNIYVEDDKIIRRKVNYGYLTTPVGWYQMRDELRTYNSDGFLIEKEISKNPYGDNISQDRYYELITYHPPGKIIGKTLKKENFV